MKSYQSGYTFGTAIQRIEKVKGVNKGNIEINGKAFPTFKSTWCNNVSPVYVSDEMSAKLQDIPAISTNLKMNKRCMHRAACGHDSVICTHCYAGDTTEQYTELEKFLTTNTYLLTTSILPAEMLPVFGNNRAKKDCKIHTEYGVRFEAFGDLINDYQAINYLNIARINPNVTFALWTKNPDILAKAVKAVGKPENINLIYSSPIIDKPISPEFIRGIFPFIDKVFSVWSTPDSASANQARINCGTRQCKECRICYTKNNVSRINELLK